MSGYSCSPLALRIGTCAAVVGLTGRVDLNGQKGVVQSIRDDGRLMLQLFSSGETVAVKGDNLRHGEFRCLRNFTKQLELNGQMVELMEAMDVHSRVLVELPDGRKIRVPQGSLADTYAGVVSELMRKGRNVATTCATWLGVAEAPTTPEPADYRILLLGATGSGKTSLLNLFCNFNHVNAADMADPTKLLAFHDMELENSKNQMESQTSDASVYRASFSKSVVEIVDTPGFGDTRGPMQDGEHQGKIINTLSRVETLNCIVVVVSGADARMNVHLECVLQSIAAIMPAKVLPKVFVVYTHVDKLLKLTFKHEELEKKLNMKSLDFIVIDNPYSLLQNAKALKGVVDDAEIAEDLRDSFKKARVQLVKFQEFMEKSQPTPTSEFKILYDKKCLIERNTLNLIEDLKQCAAQEKELRNKRADLDRSTNTAKVFQNYATPQKVMKWVCEKTERHNTLCAFPDCYCNCHLDCRLNFTVDKDIIKNCAAMKFGDSDTCGKCSHHYEQHFHNHAKWEKREEIVNHVDAVMQNKFKKANSEAERKQILLDEFQQALTSNSKRVIRLKFDLILTITDFEAQGCARNYKKVLASQIRMLDTYIETKEGEADFEEMVRSMQETKAHLEQALAAINKGANIDSDPEFRKKWACKIMGVSEATSESEVMQAYKKKSIEYHPDKPGGEDEMFKNLQKAKGILLS